MDKRFALSAAGVAGAATAATAFAGGDAVLTFHWDRYAGEAAMNVASSGGNSVGGGVSGSQVVFTSSGSILASLTFQNWNPLASSAYTSGYRFEFVLADATGDYVVTMTDTWGDGWAFVPDSGAEAFVAGGSVSGDTVIAFSSGNSAGGNISITPAPGALALLGLAGLAGRRKRA